jgi:hypothetical protein
MFVPRGPNIPMSIVETNQGTEPTSRASVAASAMEYTFSLATETQMVAQAALLRDGIDIFDAKYGRAALIKEVNAKMQGSTNSPQYHHFETMVYIIHCAYGWFSQFTLTLN